MNQRGFVYVTPLLIRARNLIIKPESGIRSRSITSPGGLCFLKSKCIGYQKFIAALSDTCVCRLGHLPLSRQRIVAVKQGVAGAKALFCLSAVNRRIQEISAR